LWDADEARARGFACPREWKARLTSTEYEREKAISRKWFRGDLRRDIGVMKSALFVGSCFTEIKAGFDPLGLLPNAPPEGDEGEQLVRNLERWPGAALEP
jgi:hypothetical protein